MIDIRKIEKQPTVFISYAWETDTESNNKLQKNLKQLYSDLLMAGIGVNCDIFDMKSDMENFMREGVKNCDFVILIGTPTLKEKLKDETKNVSKEYACIMERHKASQESKKNFLFPLLFTFETKMEKEELYEKANSSYPDGFTKKFLIRDFTDYDFDFVKYTDNLSSSFNPKGLIPIFFNIDFSDEQYKDYINLFISERDILLKDFSD